ncbi:MAG: DUF4870 domain-containing protein [Candidatus Hydrogenedentes bacterium]|nr:DUF4870 domain-containing protein [Candidatus Hydrogenedentota bacterium]
MDTTPSSDEKTMAMVCHLLGLVGYVIPFGNIVAPLVLWQMKKEGSAYIDYHGKEAVNFQIALTVYIFVAALSIMVLIGFVLAPLVGIAGLILMVMAAIKAKDGENYRYPFIFRLL